MEEAVRRVERFCRLGRLDHRKESRRVECHMRRAREEAGTSGLCCQWRVSGQGIGRVIGCRSIPVMA